MLNKDLLATNSHMDSFGEQSGFDYFSGQERLNSFSMSVINSDFDSILRENDFNKNLIFEEHDHHNISSMLETSLSKD